jgi:hypothetical protein
VQGGCAEEVARCGVHVPRRVPTSVQSREALERQCSRCCRLPMRRVLSTGGGVRLTPWPLQSSRRLGILAAKRASKLPGESRDTLTPLQHSRGAAAVARGRVRTPTRGSGCDACVGGRLAEKRGEAVVTQISAVASGPPATVARSLAWLAPPRSSSSRSPRSCKRALAVTERAHTAGDASGRTRDGLAQKVSRPNGGMSRSHVQPSITHILHAMCPLRQTNHHRPHRSACKTHAACTSGTSAHCHILLSRASVWHWRGNAGRHTIEAIRQPGGPGHPNRQSITHHTSQYPSW